jgi:hypothetical protein
MEWAHHHSRVMPNILLYSFASPQENEPASWYRYRDHLAEMLDTASNRWHVVIEDDPLFRLGARVSAVVERISGIIPASREIIVVQWSAFTCHASAALVVGAGVPAAEVRAALRGEHFLREHAGEFRVDSGSCFGYWLEPGQDADQALLAQLVGRIDQRVYAGEAVRFVTGVHVLRNPDRSKVAVVRAPDAGVEHRIWNDWRELHWIVVAGANDPLLASSTSLTSLHVGDELQLFMDSTGERRRHPRVTIGRCHEDSSIVCLYNAHHVPDDRLIFVV